MVSKKSVIKRVKTNNTAVTKPAVANPPNKSKRPNKLKSGVAIMELGIAGTFRFHPLGFTLSGAVNNGPILNKDSRITARTVAAITPIKIAPFVFVEYKIAIKIRPKINTTTGQPTRLPPAPNSTGTGPD